MQTGFKLFLTIFLITLSGLFGQEGGPPMLTDDARVADYKEWELNTSFNLSVTENNTVLSIPHLDLNYGILPNLQLKIEAPLLLDFRKGDSSKTEIGDVIAGVKYRFLGEEKHLVSAATFPQYTLNNTRGFFLPVFIEKTFNQFLLGAGVANFWGEDGRDHHEFGFLTGYRTTEKLHLMLEYYSIYNHHLVKGQNGFMNFGFRQELNESFFLMASLGTQLDAPSGVEKEKIISWVGLRTLF